MGRPKGSKNKKTIEKERLALGVVSQDQLPDDPLSAVMVPVGVNTFYLRHKGPFTFNVTRKVVVNKSTGRTELQSQYLSGRMDAEDVESEAKALLEDPRDTILSVSVWSESEEQFVTSFRR